jgi:hypothetical protein
MSSTEIWLDEYFEYLRQELEARQKRGELLSQYQHTWTDDEWEAMSNRRKLKGTRVARNETPGLRQRIRAIQNTFVGRYNAYICNTCGKGFLTLDIDPGTTPFMSPCLATEGCTGMAQSMGYPEGEPPAHLGDPIIHWVKPTEEELLRLPPQLVEHVERGGLIRKATEAAPEWVRMRIAL